MATGPTVIGVRELRTHLSAYLRKVARGETVTLGDRNRRPIARLVPAGQGEDVRWLEELAQSGAVGLGSGRPGQGGRVKPRRRARSISDFVTEDRR